jgi:hypothetical protein
MTIYISRYPQNYTTELKHKGEFRSEEEIIFSGYASHF